MNTNITNPPHKPFIFVLMPFDQAFNDIYIYGIKEAARGIGAYAERLDEQVFMKGMLDQILDEIDKADVIVADMTGRNPNVFYEVGYAHALGKVVLLLTQNADDIPFDLKHKQHIVYFGSIDTLRKQLAHKLTWAIQESIQSFETAKHESLLKVIRRMMEINRGAYSDVNMEDWKLIHLIDEMGNDHSRDEFTIVPAKVPLYFYPIKESRLTGSGKQQNIKVTAESLTYDMPLTFLELDRTYKDLEGAIFLDPPSTPEKPHRIAVSCEYEALWEDLIKNGEEIGAFRSTNPVSSIHVEFIAPPGRTWKGIYRTPEVGTCQIEYSGNLSRILWYIPTPEIGSYRYRLFLQ